MKWAFLSVGVGSEDFEKAAERLVRQAKTSSIFAESRSILTREINFLIPELASRATDSKGDITPGYGFYSWKSRVARIALEGGFGKFDGIVLVDAGCEFFVSSRSIRRLKTYLDQANIHGVAAFAISTPESSFTKNRVFRYFPRIPENESSQQFQSGILFISRLRGLEMVKKWDDVVWADLRNVDDSVGEEDVNLYAHRHDQSILSLVLKSEGIVPILNNPPGVVSGFHNAARAFAFPIWWSRNRTGNSLIPGYLQLIGLISFKVSKFKDLAH